MQNSKKEENNKAGKNILFVCAANIHRSPTAEFWFSLRHPGNEYQSAGSSRAACRIHGGQYITQTQLEWASQIICMDSKNKIQIEREFGKGFSHKIEVVDIPDEYRFLELSLLLEIMDKIKIQ